MKNLGLRIRHLRNSAGLTQQGLADKLNISDSSTISQWERGVNSPYGKELVKLSKEFNVSTDYILGINIENEKQEYNTYTYLPTAISAGLPINVEAITNPETISLPDNVMGKWAGSKDIYITRVNGESMNLVIPDQSLIAVKPMDVSDLKNGDIVIYNYDNEYAVKRFFRQNDKVIFRPDSNDLSFTDLVIDNNELDLKIKGKVVLYIVELD